MRFTEVLLKEAMPIWEKYLEHPFIQELGEGVLDIDLKRHKITIKEITIINSLFFGRSLSYIL